MDIKNLATAVAESTLAVVERIRLSVTIATPDALGRPDLKISIV